MNVVVCLKRVPMTQEMDLEIDSSGKGIRQEGLAWVLNDWDNYAIEEAVRLRGDTEGSVTAVTVGGEDDEEVLRRALAMGADRAVRVDPGTLELDPFVIAKLLAAVIRKQECELVLTGVQADDDNYAMVGGLVAEELGIGHAAVVTGVEPEGTNAQLRLELEGGVDELARVQLPALLSVQTGINEPRYVSIMGIRKAGRKPLDVVAATELGIPEQELAARVRVEEVYLPPETGGAEMLTGDPSGVAEKILRILTKKGVSI